MPGYKTLHMFATTINAIATNQVTKKSIIIKLTFKKLYALGHDI